MHRQTAGYPARLYFNQPMMEVLRRAIDPQSPQFGGAILEPQDMARALRELAKLEKRPDLGPNERQTVQRLRVNLIRARASHGGAMVITQQYYRGIRRALMEEMSHHGWLSGGDGRAQGGYRLGDLLSDDAFKDVVRSIVGWAYNRTDAGKALGSGIVEAVAKIGQPWDWPEFGITREQALQAASHIVDLLEKTRGAKARDVVKWWERNFQKELYDYKTARGWKSRFQSLPRSDQRGGLPGGDSTPGGVAPGEGGGGTPEPSLQ